MKISDSAGTCRSIWRRIGDSLKGCVIHRVKYFEGEIFPIDLNSEVMPRSFCEVGGKQNIQVMIEHLKRCRTRCRDYARRIGEWRTFYTVSENIHCALADLPS